MPDVDAVDTPWWADHYNLATTARYMFGQGSDQEDVLYMITKPWKFTDEFEAAQAELELEMDLQGLGE
jgi:hypothetical protein